MKNQNMLHLGTLLLACLSITELSLAQAPTARPFTLTDFRNVVQLSSPRISPDGRWVAVVRSTADFKADKQIMALLLVDTATGKSRALTDGKKAVSSPRWSPVTLTAALCRRGCPRMTIAGAAASSRTA